MPGLVSKVLRELLNTAEQKARGFCTSSQLRAHMSTGVIRETKNKARGHVFVPEYWAIYYHMGRANMPVIHVKRKKYLAWFPDPHDDPRLVNGEYPIRRSDVVSLDKVISRDEFKFLLKTGKLVLSKVSPTSGGNASFQGNRFFGSAPGEGLAGMVDRADSIAGREAYRAMEKFLKETGLKKKKITTTAYVKGS